MKYNIILALLLIVGCSRSAIVVTGTRDNHPCSWEHWEKPAFGQWRIVHSIDACPERDSVYLFYQDNELP